MKKNSIYFIIANVVGILLLVFTVAHFKTPIFGWLISGAIVMVFAVGMERYRKVFLHLATEEDLLEQYNAQKVPEPIGNGVIADRIRRVKELSAKGLAFDAKMFSEILSARESVSMNRSPGGIVVLLGLAGTFYGLMVAITRAGASLDATNTNTTLSAIHSIFSSMNGIFGTSFCGLVAALFLNATHSYVSSRKMAYMADVEEYTQFHLVPAFAPKGENSEELRRNALVEQLSQVVVSMQTSLQTQITSAMQSLAQNLETVTRSSSERMESIQQKASEGISHAISSSMASMEQSTQTLLDRVGKTSAESIAKQTEQSQVQWTAALETVRGAMLQNAEQGKVAIDSILSIGSQVAQLAQRVSDQADSRAVVLAQNVGAQVEQLAKDVQASFTMLAQSSRELVDSQRVLLEEITKRQDRERELAEGLQTGVGEAGTLMRINQSEFQASLELFRQGVEALLEKFSGGSAEQENQRTFIDQLTATLEAFSEKASEVLVENSMRTQEILLEVLEQTRVGGQQAEQG